jgi:hypothetical protein
MNKINVDERFLSRAEKKVSVRVAFYVDPFVADFVSERIAAKGLSRAVKKLLYAWFMQEQEKERDTK